MTGAPHGTTPTYVARGLEGIGSRGLIRYLDTNTYYRSRDRRRRLVEVADHGGDYRAAKGMTTSGEGFLPVPSLYRFSKDLHLRRPGARLRRHRRSARPRAAALERGGRAVDPLREPWLGHARAEDAAAGRAALTPVLAGRTARTVVPLCRSGSHRIFPAIRDLPWNTIGL